MLTYHFCPLSNPVKPDFSEQTAAGEYWPSCRGVFRDNLAVDVYFLRRTTRMPVQYLLLASKRLRE